MRRSLLILLLVCGCLGGKATTTTLTVSTTSTTTLNYDWDEMIASAKATLLEDGTYDLYACRGMRLNSTEKGLCEDCLTLIWTYECLNQTNVGEGTYLNVVSMQAERGDILAKSEPSRVRMCVTEADCVPRFQVRNVRYVCNDRLCEKAEYDDYMSSKCIEDGNFMRMKVLENKVIVNMCVFENGDECEIGAYYFGRCDKDSENLSDCTGYSSGLCRKEYVPACAKVEIMVNGSKDYTWRDFNNACAACKAVDQSGITVGYRMGNCPIITTSTLREVLRIPAEVQYCEDMGYAYRLRTYASGLEYGVCVFGPEDECNALDYFNGICEPLIK